METALTNADMHTFKGKYKKYGEVGHKRKQYPHSKKGGGRCGGGGGCGNGGIWGSGGSNIAYNHCKTKDHTEADCWKQSLEKAPE